tara:strand:- start:92 stop:658 length:567 start_codon:yes stop_codon:yes gene_type:complete
MTSLTCDEPKKLERKNAFSVCCKIQVEALTSLTLATFGIREAVRLSVSFQVEEAVGGFAFARFTQTPVEAPSGREVLEVSRHAEDEQGVFFYEAVFDDSGEELVGEYGEERVGRVGENQVEGASELGGDSKGVSFHNFEVEGIQARAFAGRLQVSPKALVGEAVQFHEGTACGSSADGFKSVGARARE